MTIKYYGLLALVLIVLALTAWEIMQFIGRSESKEEVLINAFSASDHVKGNLESQVVLIEYSDFQCPACGVYYPVVEQVVNEFSENIVFVYRHFPLQQIHKNAQLASYAAEAAGKQVKFWEMYTVLFEKQKEWSQQKNAKDLFVQYAGSLALNVEQFKTDIESKEVSDKVEDDFNGGLGLGVNATPTFFLNGTKIQNPRSYEEFKSSVQDAIMKNNL